MRTVAANQRELIETYAPIEDRQERLALVVDAARHQASLPASARTDDHLVKGCQSRVWVVAEYDQAAGVIRFRADGDSPFVNGLVALLLATYHDASPTDIVASEPTVLNELGLSRDLSPTRQNGLAAVRARIKALAAAHT